LIITLIWVLFRLTSFFNRVFFIVLPTIFVWVALGHSLYFLLLVLNLHHLIPEGIPLIERLSSLLFTASHFSLINVVRRLRIL
jgi:hypothetical protein